MSPYKKKPLWVIVSLMAMLCVTVPVRADGLDTPVSFDIAAQSLGTALLEFARQSRIQVISSAADLGSKRTVGVSGLHTPRVALGNLLAGSSLSFVESGANTVTITVHSAAAPDSVSGVLSRETLEEVTVTASTRVVRSGFTAPTPTTTLGVDDLRNTGATSVADLLNKQVPAFKPSVTPSSSVLGGSFVGSNFLDLRGLGPKRTLTLVDGRRHVPTNTAGFFDINVVPQALIEQIEVVTGGASASWGSDAVSGVANLIFRKKLEGIESEIQYGATDEGDNEERRVSLAYGTSFAADRGQFMIAGDFVENDGALDVYSRDWTRADRQLVINPAWAPGNGEPQQIRASNVHLTAAEGGLIFDFGPLTGIQFGPGGIPMPFDFGDGTFAAFPSQLGGDGVNPNRYRYLSPPTQRKSVFARTTFDFSDAVSGFLEGSYARSTGHSRIFQTFDFLLPISQDNAYLPASVRDQMIALGLPAIGVNRLNTDFGFIGSDDDTTTARFAIGAEGRFGDGWTWDTYYQYGEAEHFQQLTNNRIEANYARAVDAIIDPGSGEVVCRSTLTDPSNGCVPINLFGYGSPSAAALAYIHGEGFTKDFVTQHAAAFTVQGTPFSTWAGPVSIATGAEYRRDSAENTNDDLTSAGAFFIGTQQPFGGSINVKEAFAETVLPLANDAVLADLLELNAAARITDYSTAGSVTTWKVGLNYKPVNDLRFRITRSRDIRAGSVTELFINGTMSVDTVLDPLTGTRYPINTAATGNPHLEPEKADTITAGLVYEPSWLTGMRVTADIYDIDIKGAIASLNTQDTVDRCAMGAPEVCALITRDPGTGLITSIASSNLNLARVKSRGADLELSFVSPLAGGTLSLRTLLSYVDELSRDDGVTFKDNAGEVGADNSEGVPRVRGNVSANYQIGPLGLYVGGRYIGGGKYNKAFGPEDIDDNDVGSIFYVDSSIRYALADRTRFRLEVFGVASNVFDRSPPANPSSFFIPWQTNPFLYDVMGRAFAVGVRMEY